LARKVRLVMSTFAIVLGVAFVAGTLVFTDTLNRSFTALFASTVGDVVVAPVTSDDAAGPPGGAPGGPPGAAPGGTGGQAASTLPARLVKRLARVEGAARADGNVLDATVFVIDKQGK